ncbi:MAG: 30S ribosomal protein S6 [Acidobacteria bacterium]|nr:30S ribosomal protein S6 [Acidobacteriota bacterium]MBI3657205.1 30S ribosomal protein S6 [Acidobacteriota bacterium]
MRVYEIVFIITPTHTKEEVDSYTDQVIKTIESKNGKIVKVDKSTKRPLAYKIGKFKEGYYVILTVEGDGAMVAEVERRFKVSDFVVRFLSVRVDDDWKRVEKMKVKRGANSKGHSYGRASDARGSAANADA